MDRDGLELPAELASDIDAYEEEVRRFLSGEMPPDLLKAKRVPRGVYEERTDGSYMVRVRVTAGILTGEQAQRLSELSSQFGNGILHITTRQDVQLHGTRIQDTPEIMRRLLSAGLTTKGGGGNTVRNVTACPFAGVCPQEGFDVSEYARAITAYLIRLTGSYNLPRKYKISFSGCRADCGMAQVSDLGFISQIRNGQFGFRVFAAGGMGASSRIASLLVDWIPGSEVIRIAEAIRRVFDRYGDRKNRSRARLRFVIDKLGEQEFRTAFDDELSRVIADGVPQFTPCSESNPSIEPKQEFKLPAIQESGGVRYLPQRQEGWVTVPLHVQLGDVSSADLSSLARLASRFSAERGLRTTRAQALQLRSVKQEDLPSLAAELRKVKSDFLGANALDRRFVSCAGAATCRLGLCLSRNAVTACNARLRSAAITEESLDGFMVHVNGCPNACGHQPIAPIGFSGAAQRVNGRLVPFYKVTVGGFCNSQGARFGSLIGQIPAKALPDFISEVVADFALHRGSDEVFSAYFDRMGHLHFKGILSRWMAVPRFEDRPDFYQDFGSEGPFSLAGRGAGECGSGVFAVIEEGLATASKALEPYDILLPACRSLLITRGIDSQDADSVFRSFEEHFINTGLVGEEFRPLILRARSYVQGWKEALQTVGEGPARLLDRIRLLFSTLDGNLEFHPPERESAGPKPVRESQAEQELDLRGVGCPINFVKAKLKLETLNRRDLLRLILDDGSSVKNVTASFRAEGQQVESIVETGDGHWRVTIRKMT